MSEASLQHNIYVRTTRLSKSRTKETALRDIVRTIENTELELN